MNQDLKEYIKTALKTLMWIVAGLFVLALFSACKAKKHVTRTTEETHSETFIQKDKTEIKAERDMIESIKAATAVVTDTEIFLTFYDTTQDTNPVKATAHIRQTKNENEAVDCDVSEHSEEGGTITSEKDKDAADAKREDVEATNEIKQDRLAIAETVIAVLIFAFLSISILMKFK